MFDFFTTPFEVIFDFIKYSLIFGASIIMILTIGAVVAIPIGLKLLGVAFAKTIVVETSKVVRDLGLDKIAVDTKELNNKLQLVKGNINETHNYKHERKYI